jgi:hypothetical protein
MLIVDVCAYQKPGRISIEKNLKVAQGMTSCIVDYFEQCFLKLWVLSKNCHVSTINVQSMVETLVP